MFVMAMPRVSYDSTASLITLPETIWVGGENL